MRRTANCDRGRGGLVLWKTSEFKAYFVKWILQQSLNKLCSLEINTRKSPQQISKQIQFNQPTAPTRRIPFWQIEFSQELHPENCSVRECQFQFQWISTYFDCFIYVLKQTNLIKINRILIVRPVRIRFRSVSVQKCENWIGNERRYSVHTFANLISLNLVWRLHNGHRIMTDPYFVLKIGKEIQNALT